ncbi:MAG: response regulator [Dehalococcoidia bacterium]
MTGKHKKRSILVVDDEDAVRGAVALALAKEGYDVTDAWSGADALTKVAQERFDAAILDIRMPEMTGFDVMHAMRRMCPDTILIILTAMPDPESRFESLTQTAGVYAYLKKPCKLQTLKDTIARALAQQ